MIIKLSKNVNEVLSAVNADVESNKRYIKSGCKIGGEVNGNKIQLQLNDDYGKHSGFMSQAFYGTATEVDGSCEIKGSFRLKNYVLILLAVLLAVAVESIVSTLIIAGISTDLFLPAIIIVAEIFYLFYMKRASKANNDIILDYINSL
jgi:hypothetical protein